MNSFDFEYYKPDTLDEAVECFHSLESANKTALYYAGGTEIISMARAESLKFNAVIDLKGIAECNKLGFENGMLVLGSTITLTQIAESGYFPLLCETVSRIADHTIQGKITLGGNIAGTIKYREAALPLMITNCKVKIMRKNGLQKIEFSQIFDGKLHLKKGEFLVQFEIDENLINLPYVHVKKTKMEKIDYPLITLTGQKHDTQIKAAVSGIADVPIMIPTELLSDNMITEQERISSTLDNIRPVVISDTLGSKEYRLFVLENILSQMYKNWR